MTTVYKYTLSPPKDRIEISMPQGAQILCTHEQLGAICIWAQVNTQNPPETRHFVIYGTGHEIKETSGLKYLNSVFMDGGDFVFHVYEKVSA